MKIESTITPADRRQEDRTSSGTTGSSAKQAETESLGGQSAADPLRKYKAIIFGYYAILLAVCAVLAFILLDVRQRDGWQMRSIGTVQSAITQPATTQSSVDQRVEERAVSVVDFRVESFTEKNIDERTFTFDPFILLIIIAGMAGGSLHGLTSLAEHAGWHTLQPGWGPYYAGLPLSGAGMALAIYFILRSGIAGFEVVNASAPEATYLAWAVLAGLFSANALRKLGDVFTALFQSREVRRGRREEGGGGPEKHPAGARGGSVQPAKT